MSLKGVENALSLTDQWYNILKNAKSGHIISDSERLSSAKTQIIERGSLKDRLAQTDEEAEINSHVEHIRLGQDSIAEDTSETMDDAIIDKMVNDYIEKTLLGGM